MNEQEHLRLIRDTVGYELFDQIRHRIMDLMDIARVEGYEEGSWDAEVASYNEGYRNGQEDAQIEL